MIRLPHDEAVQVDEIAEAVDLGVLAPSVGQLAVPGGEAGKEKGADLRPFAWADELRAGRFEHRLFHESGQGCGFLSGQTVASGELEFEPTRGRKVEHGVLLRIQANASGS